jgi:hypothetical protein
MADGKGTARTRRSRPAQVIRPQRTQNMGWQANRVNVALPLSMIRTEEPVTMRAGDWISLAGLVVSAIGFSVAIRELIRIARASEAGAQDRVFKRRHDVPGQPEERVPPAG